MAAFVLVVFVFRYLLILLENCILPFHDLLDKFVPIWCQGSALSEIEPRLFSTRGSSLNV